MQREDRVKMNSMNNDLVSKNSQLHAQRLKKLQSQLSINDYTMPQPAFSKFDMTMNTKYLRTTDINKEKQKFSSQKVKNQILITPIQQYKYFHNVSLKNIDNQNKILFKKIQRIVKGNNKKKSINEIKASHNHSKSILSNLDDEPTESTPNNTTQMAQEISKNRATMAQIKQKQIRDANLRMLDRLMNIKPTIETRKILTQTHKNKQISHRISRFNTFESQKQESQKDFVRSQINNSVGRKKLSLDAKIIQREIDVCNGCNHLTRKKFSTGYMDNFPIPMKRNIDYHRRTVTQPIQQHNNDMKLPYIVSPSGSNNFTTTIKVNNETDDPYGSNRSKSTNNRYDITTKNKEQKSHKMKVKRASSVNDAPKKNQLQNDNSKRFYQTNSNKLNKNIKRDSNQFVRESLNSKKQKNIIILSEIQKFIQNQLITFRFIRSNVLYQIHINDSKRHSHKSKDNKQVNKKNVQEFPQSLKELYPSSKMYSPKHDKNKILMKKQQQKDFVIQNEKEKTTNKINKVNTLKQNRIILNEIVGSQLFSYLDYDYHRIIDQCLQLRLISHNEFTIQMREQYYNFRQPRQIRKYKNNQSIRENDQSQEEDSYHHDTEDNDVGGEEGKSN